MKRVIKTPEIVRWLMPCGFLAIVFVVCVSCASVRSHHIQYVGVAHQPPGEAGKVEILRAEPTRSHDRLGEVMVDATMDPAPPIEKVEERLRQEAAALGADAVVVVHDRIQPTAVYVTGGWWTRSVQTVTGRKLIGVAIKYKP